MSISPPPSPSRKQPDRGEERFIPIHLPCEWIENYRPGGYHPVHLGDVFNKGQYKVIRKLGEGSNSTVWLAHDLRRNKYVALKILVSKVSDSTNEARILQHLARVAPTEGCSHITQLLDEFEHTGPNGIHKCLVMETMGADVNHMKESLPEFRDSKWKFSSPPPMYPLKMARSILKQSLQALAFLHANGIAQGDFQPGNILFSLKNINFLPEHSLQPKTSPPEKNESADNQDEMRTENLRLNLEGDEENDETSTSESNSEEDTDEDAIGNLVVEEFSPLVRRLDGKEDKWAPRYLCIAQPLIDFTDYSEGFNIKLSDVGGAYFFADPPANILVPRGLRAPELIHGKDFNKSFDIWSFGCLVFELITGQPLFCIPWGPSTVEMDDDHLLSLADILGPLPEDIFNRWERSSLYFTADRKIYNYQVGGVKEGEEPLMIDSFFMEELFDQAEPKVNKEEAEQIKALIRWILQYDPAKRPSAAEILNDPWFREINTGRVDDLSK